MTELVSTASFRSFEENERALDPVLLAREDDEARAHSAKVLREKGHAVLEIEDGAELSDYLDDVSAGRRASRMPSVIISDATMSGIDGIDILAQLRAAKWNVPFVVLNPTSDPLISERARALNATLVLEGPLDAADVIAAVRLAPRIAPPCNCWRPGPWRAPGERHS